MNSLVITKLYQKVWHRSPMQRFNAHMSKIMRRHRLLHATIIVICVVLVWRGIWGAIDLYLLPSAPILSNAISIVAGLGILLIVDNFELEDLK